MSFPEIPLDRYIAYLEQNGRHSTAYNHRRWLGAFRDWLRRTKHRGLDEFQYTDAEEYMHHLGKPWLANKFKDTIRAYQKYRIVSLPLGDPGAAIEIQRQGQLDGLRQVRQPRVFEKISLEPQEVREFLGRLATDLDPLVHSLGVLLAYWGCRPLEVERDLGTAKLHWETCEVFLRTSKTGHERYLCWPPQLTPHVKRVHEAAPLDYPGEWFTKKTKWYQEHRAIRTGGIRVTAKTFRRTFQTQERVLGVPDRIIDLVLGHENSSSRMGDTYTDFTAAGFRDQIRDVLLTDKHYLIKNNII